ncbi:hypothetical protein AVEN_143815-1 [Araneus ventricosus]|uniref:Reverse transcriptase domain-containing protein n=1 Tax=Araneus ventricosus TaxID=182803 RepID=A0A4Y2LSU6_ARAVE|nr:hypothetical protein AVEN_143815-1 [Araneus ventricosus]
MIRFRKHEFVFTADVRMMYRQILIHPDQRDLQRIVWKEGPDQPTKAYQLDTITYGTTTAPYLATRTLNQLLTKMTLFQMHPLLSSPIAIWMSF